MKVSSLLKEKNILVGMQKQSKDRIIEELVSLLVASNCISEINSKKVVKAVINRENLGSTGLERGIAVPHAKTDSVNQLVMALGTSPEGIDFDSMDGKPSHLFFLLLAPAEIKGPHIRTLADIASLTQNPNICLEITKAATPKEILEIISQAEKKENK